MKKISLFFTFFLFAFVNYAQCDTEASFEYELIDGTWHFTNTSTGEDGASVYEWYVDDFLWSYDENPTLGMGDTEEGTIICFVVYDEITECVDEVCIELEFEEEPCDTEASFEYELIDGVWHFTNTSTGEDGASVYEWYVDDFLWSDDENPTLGMGDTEEGTIICFVVYDEITECVDEVCIELEFEEEPCDTEASFEYELIDGVWHFTNTSTGEDGASVYEWYVDDFLWSDDENPTLGLGDTEEGTIICFVVYDEVTECVDEICIELEFEEEPCELEVSFEYVILDGVIYFTNTSTGEGEASTYEWSVDEFEWSDDENPTLGLGDVEDGSVICLEIHDEVTECAGYHCIEIELIEPCEMEVMFEMEVIDGDVHFTDITADVPSDATYAWYDDGELFSEMESPVVPLTDIEAESNICLRIMDESEECEASYCDAFYSELELGITTTSISTYHVYPNPTKGELIIDLDHADFIQHIEVYNLVGALVLNKSVNTSDQLLTLDLNELKPGIYIIRPIDTDGQTLVPTQVVKQ